MKNNLVFCFILCLFSCSALYSADLPHVRVITGTNLVVLNGQPPDLAAWMEEDLITSGLGKQKTSSGTNSSILNPESENEIWIIRQNAESSGGVFRYTAELTRQNWTVLEYGVFVAATNDLRAAVRTAANRFTSLILNLSLDTNTNGVSNTNLSVGMTEAPVEGTSVNENVQSTVKPAPDGTKRFGGLVSMEGCFNSSVNSNDGVLYYSGGASFQINLFGGLYLGWKTAYDHYLIAQTNNYSYSLDVWKNLMIATYQYYFPFPVFIEAALGLGGYVGNILYQSSATNFTNMVLGAAVEPKAGIGLYFGDLVFSAGAIFNFSILFFNSSNYPLMGLVGYASVGWKF